jgi:hypothetical protein
MSTRCTIAYDQRDFHLYQECFENDNVYLHLDGEGWTASLETATVDWRDGELSCPSLRLQIDVTLWRKIVEGWMASRWGQDPSMDHKKQDFDPETLNSWLSSLARKHEEESRDE